MRNHRQDAGFSLAALIFFAAAASIVAAAAVPAYQMQAKRELEKELMFRGQEYTRAIQKYQRKFGIYPSSVDQLVQTNGLRFLRRAYKDPITGKDFRLIRINPDGSLAGSKLFVQNVNNRPLFGNTQTFGQPQQQQSSPQSGTQQQPVQQQSPQQPSQSPQFGQQTSSAPQPLQQPSQQAGQSQAPGALAGFAPIGNAGTTPISAGGVVGVASDSDEKSIMVYNQRQKYSEWEFIAITGQSGPGPQQGQPQTPGQAPGGQGQIPGGQGQTNPFGSNPSPFGPQAGPTPFGPAPGAQQGQQPFSPTNPAVPANPFNPNTPGKLP
jgi:type II secretory pathway pseudopilin PulG